MSATGWRLAGLPVYVPAPSEAPTLFETLCSEAQLILITAEVADWLPAESLRRRLREEWPLVLVLPDIRGRHQPASLADTLRRQLGMA